MKESITTSARLSTGLTNRTFPLLVDKIHLPFTVAILVKLASNEPLDEVAFLVHDFLAASAINVNIVGI